MSAAPSPWIRDVGEADFEREVLRASRERPVVVDFWAPWCGPCRMLGPVLEQLVDERQGEVVLARVNVDEAQALASRYQVSSIPLVIAFRDGKAVREFTGLLPEGQVRAFLDALVPGEADRLVDQGRGVGQGRPAGGGGGGRQGPGPGR